jgi:hypothetical protein
MGQQKIYLNWNYDDLIWGSNNYVWSEVYILIQVAEAISGGGGGLILPQKDQTWDELDKFLTKKKFAEDKKKQFLSIIARVNGLVKTEVKDLDAVKKKITVKHIKKTFEEFGQKVEVTVKNVKKK